MEYTVARWEHGGKVRACARSHKQMNPTSTNKSCFFAVMKRPNESQKPSGVVPICFRRSTATFPATAGCPVAPRVARYGPKKLRRAHQNFRRTRGAYLQRGVRLRYGKVVVMYKIPSGTHTHTARLPKRSGGKWRRHSPRVESQPNARHETAVIPRSRARDPQWSCRVL